MITKLLLGLAITSTLVSAIDYSKALDSVKVPEAISTVSKGTDMTMDDVSKSVDAAKLAEAVMSSEDTAKATQAKKEVVETKKEVTKVKEQVKEAKTAEDNAGLLNTVLGWF